jgi:hypothetical protein
MKTQEEILSLLLSGLTRASENHTRETLGDRSAYLGLSDLALGLSCPRTVAAEKLTVNQPVKGLESLLKLRRGHWLEHGLEEALTAIRRKYISQLRLSLSHENVPIEGHLDLVLPGEDNRSLTVLELKSVACLRDQVSATHEAQLYGQITLLKELWARPAFSSGDCSESFSLPELVKRRLGIALPRSAGSVSIRGFVLTVAPQAAKAFGPYEPNGDVLELLLKTGTRLWQYIASIRAGQATLDDVPWLTGFHLECDWCAHNRDCPKFQGDYQPEFEPELDALTEMKAARNDLDVEIKEMEDRVKALASLLKLPGQWINTLHYRFRVSAQAGKVTLDQNILKAGLRQAGGMKEEEFNALLASAQKTGRAFQRLQISPIN